jgi:hypothetical protein
MDEKWDHLSDSCNVLSRWQKYFWQLMNVCRNRDVRKRNYYFPRGLWPRSFLLVPQPRPLEFQISIAKIKVITRQVLIKFWQNYFKQEVKNSILKSINSLLFGMRKYCLSTGRSVLLHQFTRRDINISAVIIEVYLIYWRYNPVSLGLPQGFISVTFSGLYFITHPIWGTWDWTSSCPHNFFRHTNTRKKIRVDVSAPECRTKSWHKDS